MSGKEAYKRREILPVFGTMTLITILLTALDQFTKVLAAGQLQEGPRVLLKGVFELRYTQNRGAAFSLLQNHQWLFILISILFLAGICVWQLLLPPKKSVLTLRILLAVLAAGAAGNLIDRIQLGYVRDFLYFRLIDFPIFNLADIYVTVSAALLVLWMLFFDKEKE